MKITKKDLAMYKEAQKIKMYSYYGRTYEQNKYSYGRMICSKLPCEKYIYIADNEDKFFGKENYNVE